MKIFTNAPASAKVVGVQHNARFIVDVAKESGSKRELKLIQDTFNAWHEKSGLAYSHISRICACSV